MYSTPIGLWLFKRERLRHSDDFLVCQTVKDEHAAAGPGSGRQRQRHGRIEYAEQARVVWQRIDDVRTAGNPIDNQIRFYEISRCGKFHREVARAGTLAKQPNLNRGFCEQSARSHSTASKCRCVVANAVGNVATVGAGLRAAMPAANAIGNSTPMMV